LRKLVGRFCQEQSDFVARIQKQMAEDSEQATRTVHMFKGTSANLGLPALSAMAGHLESALAAGDTPAIAQQLQALQRALQQHLNAMGHWLGSHETV
jgi:HPt (histidine-containing phosphotransfer) domain-containing protein